MSAGLLSLNSSGPRPHFSMVPGLKFSMTTSAVFHQPLDDAAAGLAAQIGGDRLLVPGQRAPPVGGAVFIHHAPGADRVAGNGRLHLDHLGAEVAEQGAGKGAGQQLADFHDADPVQRSAAAQNAVPCSVRIMRFVS